MTVTVAIAPVERLASLSRMDFCNIVSYCNTTILLSTYIYTLCTVTPMSLSPISIIHHPSQSSPHTQSPLQSIKPKPQKYETRLASSLPIFQHTNHRRAWRRSLPSLVLCIKFIPPRDPGTLPIARYTRRGFLGNVRNSTYSMLLYNPLRFSRSPGPRLGLRTSGC